MLQAAGNDVVAMAAVPSGTPKSSLTKEMIDKIKRDKEAELQAQLEQKGMLETVRWNSIHLLY